MKTAFKICALVFLLSACVTTKQAEMSASCARPSLTDRVQAAVTEAQRNAIEVLPDEIEGLKAVEPVADREKNQRGAGFTRVYANAGGDLMATVFVYNNQNFGVSEEIDPVMEALMDKHLQEFLSLRDSGLYSNVKTGEPKQRAFRWKSVKYQVLETEVDFSHKEEDKKSLVVLGANKDMMSYVRVRYTYPKSKQAEMNKKQAAFTRTVMTALHDFALAGKQ